MPTSAEEVGRFSSCVRTGEGHGLLKAHAENSFLPTLVESTASINNPA